MILEVKNGNFGYGNRKVLNNVNFNVEDGEILAVLGSNGVGKTTLLKCMMGLQKWNSGCTCIDSIPFSEYPQKEIWKKIAYVPQAKNLIFGYTALDMVLLGRSAHLGTLEQPKKEDMEMAEKAMEDVGISRLKNQLCNCMSGGELQMVLIARALCSNPKMLVLDEPESNLDFKNQLIVLETVRKLSKERNISAIINTHYPNHALQLADKALLLNTNGTSIFGQSAEVLSEDNMQQLFSVEIKINDFYFDNRRYSSVVPLRVISKRRII